MKHNWDFLTDNHSVPYPMYFCRNCGKFASNSPSAQGSFDVKCIETYEEIYIKETGKSLIQGLKDIAGES